MRPSILFAVLISEAVPLGATELALDVGGAAYAIDGGGGVDLELAVTCIAAVEEVTEDARRDARRYLVSRDGGATFSYFADERWITGATSEQAMDLTRIADGLTHLAPASDVILRIFSLPGEPIPAVATIVITPCACGDGLIDWGAGETCDDANATGGDGCDASCRAEPGYACTKSPSVCSPVCDNAVINAGESCDDGNLDNHDGCSDVCSVEPGYACVGDPSVCLPTCGNGVLDPGEDCDSGIASGGNGCTSYCRVYADHVCNEDRSACVPACGNGVLDLDEQCDDGGTVAGDGCSPDCRREPGFSCLGEPSSCLRSCGDGVLDPGEECDDGNLRGDDGCSPSCAVEPGAACFHEPSLCQMTCGNGRADFGEQCDDGNTIAGDGCSQSCVIERDFSCSGEPSACAPRCGNGVVASDEQCDDGNSIASDGCSQSCVVEPGYTCTGEPSVCVALCGNGELDLGELCDDGNLVSGDGCAPNCRTEFDYRCLGSPSDCISFCGDGWLALVEECDDGNAAPGDGCGPDCLIEEGFICGRQSPSVCKITCDGESCEAPWPTPPPSYLDGEARGGAWHCNATAPPPPLFWLSLALLWLLRRHARRAFFVLAIIASWPASALAQGLVVQRVTPAVHPDDLMLTKVLPRTRPTPALALTSMFTKNPVVLWDGEARHVVVARRTELVLAAMTPLFGEVSAEISIPFVVRQQEDAAWDGAGFLADSSSHSAMGSPALGLTLPFLRFAESRCAVALAPSLGFVMAADTLGESGFLAGAKARASCELGRWITTAGIGADYLTERARGAGEDLTASFELGLGVTLGARGPRLAVELIGATSAREPLADVATTPVEALASIGYELSSGLRLVAAAGAGLVAGFGAPRARALGGLRWAFAGPALAPAPVVVAPEPVPEELVPEEPKPEEPKPEEPSPAPAPVVEEGLIAEWSLTFEPGSIEISKPELLLLDEVARASAENPAAEILLEGHADSDGRARANLILAADRARAVSRYLASRGVEEGRIKLLTRGEAVPRAIEFSSRGKALNRRVQVQLVVTGP